jgi:hypothetical protein
MGQAPSSLTLELEAMAAIGLVLSDLPDPAARLRVLKWATERFAAELEAAPQVLVADPAPVQDISSDPALAVDSLDEMFVTVSDETDDDLGEFAAPAPGGALAPTAPQAPLEVVIRSFAQDFQRFVEEWNGATA